MSFSKAKIKRFNDTTGCAPSPTKYDPKLNSKTTGCAMLKGDRFSERKADPNEPRSCTRSTTRFKTPRPCQDVKVKKVSRHLFSESDAESVASSSKEAPVDEDMPAASTNEEDTKVIKDPKNKPRPCKNIKAKKSSRHSCSESDAESVASSSKEPLVDEDMTVASTNEENAKVIEDLKNEVTLLETKIKTLELEKENVETKAQASNQELESEIIVLKNQIESVKTQLEATTLDLEDLNIEFDDLKDENEELKEFKSKCHNYEIAMSDTRESLAALTKRLLNSDSEVEVLNFELKVLKVEMENQRSQFDIVNNSKMRLEEEVAESLAALKERLLQSDIQVEALKQCKDELMNQLAVTKLEMRNLQIQYDIANDDKKDLEQEVAEQKKINAENKAWCETLIADSDKMIKESEEVRTYVLQVINSQMTENNEMVQHYEQLIQTLRNVEETYFKNWSVDLQEMQLKFINYIDSMNDITKEKTQILEQKLSDMNVENDQLKELLTVKNNELENLKTDLEILKTTIDVVNKDTDELRDKVSNLLVENGDLKCNNEKITRKLDHSREFISKQDKLHQVHLEESKAILTKVIDEKVKIIDSQQDEINTLNETLKESISRKEYYKMKCLEVEEINTHLKEELNKMKPLYARQEELLKKIDELESEIEPSRRQLESLECEKKLVEALKEQNLQDAEKLGHQNHRQKIKYLVNLKYEVFELKKENEKLKIENRNLKKSNSSLKEQLGVDTKRVFVGGKRPATTPFKGKENDSLNGNNSFNSTYTKDAQTPPPLKRRNQ